MLFRKQKNLMTSESGLAYFNPRKPVVVSADESRWRLGLSIQQEQPEGELQPA